MWISIITLIILDYLWIFINQKRYAKWVKNVQNSPMKVKIVPAVIAYIAMIIGLVFIIIPNAKRDTISNNFVKALKHGALFGFIVYAIYNATNYAIFDNYSLNMAIIDTCWGTTVFFIVTWIALLT